MAATAQRAQHADNFTGSITHQIHPLTCHHAAADEHPLINNRVAVDPHCSVPALLAVPQLERPAPAGRAGRLPGGLQVEAAACREGAVRDSVGDLETARLALRVAFASRLPSPLANAARFIMPASQLSLAKPTASSCLLGAPCSVARHQQPASRGNGTCTPLTRRAKVAGNLHEGADGGVALHRQLVRGQCFSRLHGQLSSGMGCAGGAAFRILRCGCWGMRGQLDGR